MKKRLSIKFNCILIALTVALSAVLLFACNDDENPYAADHNFVVRTTDGEDALEFSPVDFTPKYGIVFYCGALISPSYYTYLGESLAKQGYLVIIPKLANNFALNDYLLNEPAFTKYEGVRFFVGGHDMGGGAAVRRAMECKSYIKGVFLYSPLAFKTQKFENGQLVFDDDGDPVWQHFSIANQSIPTLLLETDEQSRTDELKQDAKSHINLNSATLITLNNSATTAFSQNTSLPLEQAKAQRALAIKHTLDFLRSVVA